MFKQNVGWIDTVHKQMHVLQIYCFNDDNVQKLTDNIRVKLSSSDLPLSRDLKKRMNKYGYNIAVFKADGTRIENHEFVCNYKESVLKFDIEIKPEISYRQDVKLKNSNTTRTFDLSNIDTVRTLMMKMKGEISKFEDDIDEELREKMERFGFNIDLFKPPAGFGSGCARLAMDDLVYDYKEKALIFDIRSTGIEDLKKVCDGQNIAFIGVPGHGKSSTINSLAKCLMGAKGPVAETANVGGAGTEEITPHDFRIGENEEFTLWDVPGKALVNKKGKEQDSYINSVLSGDKAAATQGKLMSHRQGIIHAIVLIQKGTAEVDRLLALTTRIARKSSIHVREIPVFAIVTHVDEISTLEDLMKKIEDIKCQGIEKSRIFTIVNVDSTSGTIHDERRDQNIYSMVEKILSTSKSNKDHIEKYDPIRAPTTDKVCVLS